MRFLALYRSKSVADQSYIEIGALFYERFDFIRSC